MERERVEQKVAALAFKDAVDRARLLSYVFSALFGGYGLTSLGFLRKFVPELTLWSNVWPRILLTSIPLLALGAFMKSGRVSDRAKLLLWITAFSIIFHMAAWIHVWPAALHGSADILTYVDAPNVYLFAVIYCFITPPASAVIPFTAILSALFVLPLFSVAYLSGDPIVFTHLLNDSVLALGASIALSRVIDGVRLRLLRLETEREQEASKFLGPVLSKAIFENESERLKTVRCKGFVVSVDIRDSTELNQSLGDAWLAFRKDYFAMVSQCVSRNGGYIQKTVGDCHVINFGIMDYGADLTDIPGIEHELARAEELRLQRASDQAFACLDELFQRFGRLARERFPDLELRLGAGIDKGWVERAVQGDGSQFELDVNGTPVNCSNRLQEYSKALRNDFGWDGSMLVISPFASDYLGELSAYQRVETQGRPVRNFPTIGWVLVRRYSASGSGAEMELSSAA